MISFVEVPEEVKMEEKEGVKLEVRTDIRNTFVHFNFQFNSLFYFKYNSKTNSL